ncbi:MAG: Thiol-disulfide oxidoreductase ResA [Candidatus Accumulibacter adjunctus]|uniref:Thiol-disulfide oxidoreductase ResA n=1 Tax=Candidatus Accumulibacter adjunctus TaxID=1454001 RepID=A0A011NT10_9PROT|nr:MAG: Thiol-disulfide oxidoreductase ResA [Candidatus Accumulibacter adjunctus]
MNTRHQHTLLALALLALIVAGCDASGGVRLNIGDQAPAFVAPTLAAGPLSFPGELRGRPVVIRFWADWCRFCADEMRAIDGVWQRHRQQGLVVLAINAGQSRQEVESFIRRIGVGYPVLLDDQAAISRRYGVVGLPTTYFVAGDGRIRGKLLGEADAATFERLASELLR